MLTSYLDLLTYPLFTWGMPLIWWIVLDDSQMKESSWVKRVVSSGVSWIAGYAIMWVMKWILATVVLGRNVFGEAIEEVLFRSGAKNGSVYGLQDRLNAVYFNWKHYGYKPYALILAGWLLWWLYRSISGGWRKSAKRYAYFLAGISSVVWYLVLANHTQGHHFFTYRIFGVSILAFLAIALDSTLDKEEGIVLARKKLTVGGVWAMLAVLAVPVTLLAREELLVLNGEARFQKIEMAQNGIVEMSFSPAFDEIRGINFGLECAGENGWYEITLWEEDIPKYQNTVFIKDCEGHFQSINTLWKLNRRKTYQITVQIYDNDEPVYIWVTEEGERPLEEYGNLLIDGIAVEGQHLAGITYWCLPVSKKILLFLFLTWLGIGGIVVSTFFTGKQ